MIFKPTKPPSGGNVNQPPVFVNENKIALCCGINDYSGSYNDLNGCVNDAKDWENLLKTQYGFKTTLLLDSQVTSEKVASVLNDMVAKAGEGWHIVWTYSGHGSNVPDKDGDEPDARDECICLYDRFFIDDEIRAIMSKLNPKTKFTFISDSCHSGTVTRAFMALSNPEMEYAKARFLPPQDNPNDAVAPNSLGRIMNAESSMNEVLISGCLPTEYSYDAYFGGKYNGAMTYHAVKILQKTPRITYTDFYTALRKALPSNNYPQSPCLEGRESNKNSLMFE